MQELGFDDWFSQVQALVLDTSGVPFDDRESALVDYNAGLSAEQVARELAELYQQDEEG